LISSGSIRLLSRPHVKQDDPYTKPKCEIKYLDEYGIFDVIEKQGEDPIPVLDK